MANKEERIFIFTQKKACDICKKSLEEYDGLQPDCSNCPFGGDENYPYVTRTEAINKIRIAMHKVFIKQEPAGPLFLNYAEAALNALLEGGKK